MHTCPSERSVCVLLYRHSCDTDVTDTVQWSHIAVCHSLHSYTHNDTVVVPGSPSTARPSSPPWLYTGTPSTWRRRSCRSLWCRRLGPPIPLCTLFHYCHSVGHKLRQVHTVQAFPLKWLGQQRQEDERDLSFFLRQTDLTFCWQQPLVQNPQFISTQNNTMVFEISGFQIRSEDQQRSLRSQAREEQNILTFIISFDRWNIKDTK